MSPTILIMESDLKLAQMRLRLKEITKAGRETKKPELKVVPDKVHENLMTEIDSLTRRIADLEGNIRRARFQVTMMGRTVVG